MNEFTQFLIAVGVIINSGVAVFGAVQSYRNGRKIEQVHLATNGMKTALVEATAAVSFIEGKTAGIEEQRAR